MSKSMTQCKEIKLAALDFYSFKGACLSPGATYTVNPFYYFFALNSTTPYYMKKKGGRNFFKQLNCDKNEQVYSNAF